MSGGLTKEAQEKLSAPFSKSVIKSYKGRGGKTMRYIEVPVLEARIASVDPSWGKHVEPGAKSVAVHYTILGVTRGDLFDNERETEKMYGAPQVNALARASRRAARLFGVGAELWEDDDDEGEEEEDDRPARKGSTSSSKSGSGSGGASPEQVKLLKKFGVPDSLAKSKELTGGREGTASAIIGALIAARKDDPDEYDEDPQPHILRAVKKADKSLLSLLEEESDEDED